MRKIIIFLLILTAIYSCEQKELGPIDSDTKSPGPISIVRVTNLSGGAKIEYDIPSDVDLLYVKAIYTITNGRTLEVKSSLYEKSLIIKGFNDEVSDKEYEVSLVAVDRSNNESSPVKVMIKPETSPLWKVKNSMSINRSFGGASFTWENEEKNPITFYFMVDTVLTEGASAGELTEIRIIKNELEKGEYVVRGYPDSPRKFAVLITDNYGNSTDLIKPPTDDGTITPYPEARLDKKIMNIFNYGSEHPVDDKWDYWQGKPWSIIDDDYSSGSVAISYQSPYPRHITVDLGKPYKLSRYVWWQRNNNDNTWFYTYGNPKNWYVYVRKEAPVLAEEITEDLDGDGLQDWTNYWTLIGNHEIVKPSGLPVGQRSQEDIDLASEGHNFDFPIELTEMRYIRYGILSNFDGSGWCNWSEIDFYGTDKF